MCYQVCFLSNFSIGWCHSKDFRWTFTAQHDLEQWTTNSISETLLHVALHLNQFLPIWNKHLILLDRWDYNNPHDQPWSGIPPFYPPAIYYTKAGQAESRKTRPWIVTIDSCYNWYIMSYTYQDLLSNINVNLFHIYTITLYLCGCRND